VSKSRDWIVWAVVAVAVVGSVILFGRQGPGAPLDPRSTKANGAKALVYLLEQYGTGVDVTTAVPSPGASARVLVLVDHLSARQRDAITDFVRAGGEAVIADPTSPLVHGGTAAVEFAAVAALDPGLCTVTALRAIDAVKVSAGAGSVPVGEGDTSCFGNRDDAYLVVHGEGRGTIVALGGASQWTNDLLDEAANAALATTLLAPAPAGRVAVLRGDGAGGEQGLFDLVPNRVWFALGQIGVGFVVLALWRARRLGRVVVEPQPVEIAGSELVVASGRILDRIAQPQRAADVLRRELAHDLATRYGLRGETDVETLDATVSASGRVPPGTVLAVFGETVSDERSLVALAGRVDAVRKEVL
jgi:hypothetical protein